jgi:oxygen-dependent protoporphyrinogen oxidase
VELDALVVERGTVRLAARGGSVDAAAAILAVPAYEAARLVRAIAPDAAAFLSGIRYYPSLTVNLGYHTTQVRGALAGTGFVVSPAAGVPLRACTYASRKFPGRAPPGHVLLRAFLATAPDHAPRLAHELLASILDIEGEPLWHRRDEWPRGLPQYAPDHAARLAAARNEIAAAGPLVLAGAGYDGAGVSACVRSGRAAAASLA